MENGSADTLLFNNFRFDRRAGCLFRLDHPGMAELIPLGARGLGVLGILLDRKGELVSKHAIMEAVWSGRVVEEGNLNVQIGKLRHILDHGQSECSCIQTITGYGYRFIAPVTRADATAPLASSKLDNNAGARRQRLSIVVLPFANLSEDRAQQYFADAITDDVTIDLLRIEDMFVVSRNTAFTYRNKSLDSRQIGRDLCVHYVLDGSVWRSGNKVRVSAELIDTDIDACLWAERFDGDTADLFALQNEITSRIAVALNLELVAAEARRSTEHADALDYILRGRAAILTKPVARDGCAEAIGLFERALELDPQSAEAQSWLATALIHHVLDDLSGAASADILRAAELAEQALAAAPRSPLAHYAKGQVLRAQSRPEDAICEYEMVIALNRNSVCAMSNLGWCRFLTGATEEAIRLHEQAIRLSPRDPLIAIWYGRIGLAHLLQSRTTTAILWLENARKANWHLPYIRCRLASAYALEGEIERAHAELAEAQQPSSDLRYTSIAQLKAAAVVAAPKVRALAESTYFAGLRLAGMPEK
jgi:TolB-like protein